MARILPWFVAILLFHAHQTEEISVRSLSTNDTTNFTTEVMPTTSPQCRFELELANQNATEHLVSLVNNTKTIFIFIKLNFINAEFENARFQYLKNTTNVINAGYWVWTRGSVGQFLLEAPFDFKTISFGTLSIGVERSAALDIKILPENETGCFINQTTDSERIQAIARLLLELTSTNTEELPKHMQMQQICLERQKMNLRPSFSDLAVKTSMHLILQASSYYDCWQSKDIEEPNRVKKHTWTLIIEWTGFILAIHLPLIFLYFALWKNPPTDIPLQSIEQENIKIKRLILDTDLIPVGPLYWTVYKGNQYSILCVCRWLALILIVCLIPFIPKWLAIPIEDQLYDDRIQAYNHASPYWIISVTSLKTSSIILVVASGISLIVFFLQRLLWMNIKNCETYDLLNDFLIRDLKEMGLSDDVVEKQLATTDYNQNKFSWRFMYLRILQCIKCAYRLSFHWTIFKTLLKSVIKEFFAMIQQVPEMCPEMNTMFRRPEQGTICQSLKSNIYAIFLYTKLGLKICFYVILYIIVLIFCLLLPLIYWVIFAFPFFTCSVFMPIKLQPIDTPNSNEGSDTFPSHNAPNSNVICTQYKIRRFRRLVSSGITMIFFLLTIPISTLVLGASCFVYFTEIIGYTIFGLIVHSSVFLPYCSLAIVAIGFVIYSISGVYEEYHQLYKLIFDLGVEIQNESDELPRIVEKHNDSLMIESDLFYEVVNRFKPIFTSYLKLVVFRFVPAALLVVVAIQILHTIDSLEKLSETMNFSFLIVSGAFPIFAYLLKNPTARDCRLAAQRDRIKTTITNYATKMKHKRETLQNYNSGPEDGTSEANEMTPLL